MAPLFRLEVRDGQSGAPIQITTIEENDLVLTKDWPIDADTRGTLPSPTGYPIEIRIRRIL